MGDEHERVQATPYTENGDAIELGSVLKEFDHSKLIDQLKLQKGGDSLSKLISNYLPCNSSDAESVGPMGVDTPIMTIYIPTYLTFKKCIVGDGRRVFAVVSNFGGYQVEKLRNTIVSLISRELDLPKSNVDERVPESFSLGRLLAYRNLIIFDDRPDSIDLSSKVNVTYKGVLIAQSSIQQVTVDFADSLNDFRRRRTENSWSKRNIVLFWGFFSASSVGLIGWVMLLIATLLSYFVVYSLIFKGIGIVQISPALGAITTILLVYITYRSLLDRRHIDSRIRAKEVQNKLTSCKNAYYDINRLLLIDGYVSKTNFASLETHITNWNDFVLTKEFPTIYHRLRGCLIVWRMITYSEKFANMIKSITFIGSMKEFLELIRQQPLYFEKLFDYLEGVERWLGAKYSI